MKVLKTNKYNVNRCYAGLMRVEPKQYKQIIDIEIASKILDILQPFAKDHYELLEKGDKINEDMLEISEEDETALAEINKRVRNLNAEIKIKEDKDRNKKLDIEFEDEEFNRFFQFFNNWGKNWFKNVKEFLDFNSDMEETNSKPKKDKKK